jgi:hypothetical protein
MSDPGVLEDTDQDPFVLRRIAARKALFAALEAFIRAGGRAGLGALQRAHEEWACVGRDGE